MRFMPGTSMWRFVLIVPFFMAAAVPCDAAHDKHSLAQRLFGDAADGCLDQFSLFEAALIAGGIDSAAEMAKCTEQFEIRVQPALKNIVNQSVSNDRVQSIFDC